MYSHSLSGSLFLSSPRNSSDTVFACCFIIRPSSICATSLLQAFVISTSFSHFISHGSHGFAFSLVYKFINMFLRDFNILGRRREHKLLESKIAALCWLAAQDSVRSSWSVLSLITFLRQVVSELKVH